MKMSLGEIIKAIIFGFIAGLVAAFFLLNVGDNTNEIIYGASIRMTRFYVIVVCSIACIVTEMIADTSAREVGVDIVISWICSLMFVGDNFLNATDRMESIKNIMGPVIVSVVLAAFLSEPIQRVGVKFLDWVPFKKNEK